MSGELRAVIGPTDEASSGLRGRRTAAALDRCADAWDACLKRLTAELDAKADKLRATAANYRNGDSDVRQGFLPPGLGIPVPRGGR
jgi:hypothetical protein